MDAQNARRSCAPCFPRASSREFVLEKENGGGGDAARRGWQPILGLDVRFSSSRGALEKNKEMHRRVGRLEPAESPTPTAQCVPPSHGGEHLPCRAPAGPVKLRNMAGPAVAVLISASTLLCMYLLVVPDRDAHAANRRSGRHHMPFHHVPLGLHASHQHRLTDLDAALGPLDRYFGSDGALSVRERLVYLFAMLDRSPKDGGISNAELESWLHRQAAERLGALTRREMEKHDRDGDGAVTLHEYLGVDPDQDIDWSNTEHGKPGWWQHKFASADTDESAALDTVELNDFLHPEDSSQEKVRLWILKDKLSEMDRDRDGRLSLEEFMDQSHRIDHISVAQHDGGHDLGRAEAEKMFRQLDADMDNYLTVEEARPVIQSLLAGEFSYATSHAKLLMKADDDRDGKLSLEEMLNHYVSFYDIVYMDDHFDYDDIDSDFHDELR